MRTGVVAAFIVGTGVAGALIAAAGCEPLPACGAEADIEKGRAGKFRVDLRDCPDAGEDGHPPPPPPECIPSETNSSPADDICGVFVSNLGDDANPGTNKQRPVRTLAAALNRAAASEKRVYMCAQTFESEDVEDVVVPEGFTIYGGMNCDGTAWTFSDGTARTIVTAPADRVPLRLASGARATAFHDLHVVAESATVPGGSSIAVIAENATATFVRSVLEAGNGADGVPGETYSKAAADGQNGAAPMALACSASQVIGGAGPVSECSTGGDGGAGGTTQGSNGFYGLPEGSDNGGAGEMGAAACKDGSDGALGAEGAAGDAATGLGTLDVMVGYTGVAGGDGKPGTAGRGGGGGGGAKSIVSGMNKCPGSTGGGAAGGSGASGGCGGQGGRGGGPGGASIAVVSLNSKLTFETSRLRLGNGGLPGSGSNGQDGGLGGSMVGAGGVAPASSGLKNGCKGGRGGNGGRGGAGADGLGGHVIGVAYTTPMDGPEPVFRNITVELGVPGLNGGVEATVQKF